MSGPDEDAEASFRRALAQYDAQEDPRYLEPEEEPPLYEPDPDDLE